MFDWPHQRIRVRARMHINTDNMLQFPSQPSPVCVLYVIDGRHLGYGDLWRGNNTLPNSALTATHGELLLFRRTLIPFFASKTATE